MAYPPTTNLKFSIYSEGREVSYDQIAMFAEHDNEPATEITEEDYNYLLNVLPPSSATAPDNTGQLIVPEPITSNRYGQVYTAFRERDGRFYAKWVTLRRPSTLITRVSLMAAHPLEQADAAPQTHG